MADEPQRQVSPAGKDSELHFRALIEHSFDGITLLTATGDILYASPSALRISGHTAEELVGRSVFDLIHPDDLPVVQATFTRLLHTPGGSTTVQARCRHKDGSWRWIENTGTNLLDQPHVRAIVSNYRDITAQKQAEQALQQSEERYRHLFESSPHPMLVYEWETQRFLAVNDAAVRHYGYTRGEWLQLTVFDINPVEDEARLREVFRGPAVDGRVGLWRHRKKDGSIIDVEIRGHWIALDGRRVRFVLALDVTERLRAEAAVRASEAKYRSLIENLELQVFLKDRAGRYAAANQRFCRALERAETEVVGRTDAELFPADQAEKFRAEELAVVASGQRREAEMLLRIEGQQRTFRVVRSPVRDERGAVGGVLGICWDVSEQRVLEAQLRQAQKMEAIGMLAGGVAHDFNNLLAVIVGNIALALGSLPENHASRDLLLTAERAGVQAADLTNRLLGFARQTILRPVPTQLQNCMEETVRILRRTVDPRIALEVRCAEHLWLVEADPAQINQVLLNLCLNARDAMPQGGRIALEAANVVLDADYPRQHVEGRGGEFVRLRIGDTGQGIPPEIRSRIFEPFFTTKEPGKGTGLGLAMVFGIIKQHQGWIDFTSEVGEGTCFDIFLPRHVPWTTTDQVPSTTRQAPRGGHETILLADDEPMIRKLGKTILERYGYRVLLAEDGLEAVQLYERERERIGLVLLDLTMPRLSGHDALQHLLQLDPLVRVVFASGYSAEHLDQAYHKRVMGFINKPFRPEQLAQVVREVLDHHV
ncbi:MAG: PAS domain S-box protein [Planctomycetia bacterium]|nr:PAS domain S-box protein [Planctomycetia bacterium]